MDTTGTTRVCIFLFTENSEYPSLLLEPKLGQVSERKDASELTFREHGMRNPDLARVFHAGICRKGEYNQEELAFQSNCALGA